MHFTFLMGIIVENSSSTSLFIITYWSKRKKLGYFRGDYYFYLI